MQIRLKTATHIHAQPGLVTVSETEATRLCALGIAEMIPAKAEKEPAQEKKKPTKKTK